MAICAWMRGLDCLAVFANNAVEDSDGDKLVPVGGFISRDEKRQSFWCSPDVATSHDFAIGQWQVIIVVALLGIFAIVVAAIAVVFASQRRNKDSWQRPVLSLVSCLRPLSAPVLTPVLTPLPPPLRCVALSPPPSPPPPREEAGSSGEVV